ncbi:MAG: hypothetical protein H0W54_00080 [Rubrobacter sp.]|nr:hypothetical protein [Rubrobacter sp.]
MYAGETMLPPSLCPQPLARRRELWREHRLTRGPCRRSQVLGGLHPYHQRRRSRYGQPRAEHDGPRPSGRVSG